MNTYSFEPENIKYKNLNFILNKQLVCSVEFIDDNYIIKNNELELTVWGETRKDVEDAFNFSFYSIYKNFYLEDDSNLSSEAILLKNKLKNRILAIEEIK